MVAAAPLVSTLPVEGAEKSWTAPPYLAQVPL